MAISANNNTTGSLLKPSFRVYADVPDSLVITPEGRIKFCKPTNEVLQTFALASEPQQCLPRL